MLNQRRLRNSHSPGRSHSLQRSGYRSRSSSSRNTVSAGSENDGESSNHRSTNHRTVESDGCSYKSAKDSPGQSSLYIAPGDHRKEVYRQATFARYSPEYPSYVIDLAANGFYYTGFKDRVKCFGCAMTIEDWQLGDDVWESKWHENDCLLTKGTENVNIPIYSSTRRMIFRRFFDSLQSSLIQGSKSQWVNGSTNLTSRNYDRTTLVQQKPRGWNQGIQLATIYSPEHAGLLKSIDLTIEQDRRETFRKWPSYPAPLLPGYLAKEGFFYLGNLDRTQCFSCSGVLRNWTANDDVREEHMKHFPNCSKESRNIPMATEVRMKADNEDLARFESLRPTTTGGIREPPDPGLDEQLYLAHYFPCNNAVSPHMRNEQASLETFDSRWDRDKIRATPEQIARAGFFFLGEIDKCKCWYCNGGLQNWDEDDEPWTEHCKWFPGCEFVLRRKGVDFARQLLDLHPNLDRPAIRNMVSFDIPPMPVSAQSPISIETAFTLAMESSVVRSVVAMDQWNNSLIETLVKRKLEAGCRYSTSDSLIGDILDNTEENEAI